ncbi:hypothetical protein [Nissabacter sp. SGAir0207]|uniref:hypothetical protein n=1 Tax=Nissabacter sp. SGAir0207 TaxID=2126321 RepID=UPI0010F61F5B|nr:hypothetical protein [Nissabacter sp. SGAir0207]
MFQEMASVLVLAAVSGFSFTKYQDDQKRRKPRTLFQHYTLHPLIKKRRRPLRTRLLRRFPLVH